MGGHDAPHLNLGGLELKMYRGGRRDQGKSVRETLWLDPKVPDVETGKKLGTFIKQSVNSSGKATGKERATLIYTTVGTDLGIRGLEVHPVRSGACVPSGEDSSKVRIVLLSVVKHSTSRDVLNGSLEVHSNHNPCWVSLGTVLSGLDHGVGTQHHIEGGLRTWLPTLSWQP